MKENELIFDRTKHVCYSEAVKQVITDCLKKQFSKKKLTSSGKNPVEIYRIFTDAPLSGRCKRQS